MPNPSDKDHYLSAMETRECIDANKVSLETLKQFIPTTKADTDEQKAVKHAKSLDQGRSFTATKVRATVSCDSCGADRVIFSDNAVGTKKGTSKNQLECLLRSLENGYICGNAINEEGGFFVKMH